MTLVRGKNVPEIIEVNALPSLHQLFGLFARETEMPQTWRIVDALPSGDAGKKRIHHHQLLRRRRKLRRVRVRNHQSNIVTDNSRLLDPERMHKRVNPVR